jgi:hypothetical protein
MCVYLSQHLLPLYLFLSFSLLLSLTAQHDALDLSEDGGVSRAMATVFSVQDRLPYLLTHGMIHLMGFDHETDEEWLAMTSKEDEVLGALAEEFPDIVCYTAAASSFSSPSSEVNIGQSQSMNDNSTQVTT